MTTYWQRFLVWLAARPDGVDDDMARLISVARIGFPIGLVLHLGMITGFWLLEIYPLVWVNIASIALWIVAVWRLHRYDEIRWTFVACALLEIPMHSVLATWFVGATSGFILFIISSIVLTPLASFLARQVRAMICLALVMTFVLSGMLSITQEPLVVLSPGWTMVFFGMNGGALALMVGLFMSMYEWIATTAEANLKTSRRRTEQVNASLTTVSTQLAKYISPQLYQAIQGGEEQVTVASKRKKLTIFFSDIVGFTEITDQLESEELTSLLNEYLTEMSQVAQSYGANFDKFIGDAIVLYFGDPETAGVKEDAAQCVRMAIAMQQRMVDLRARWKDQGLERPFELRIGINTGYCTVGNFGSDERMDYTIIGGAVNLAARLESHAAVGGILLAHETYAQVSDWLMVDTAEQITVKGFREPVTTYRVRGIYDALVAEGLISRHTGDGVTVTIDHARLDASRAAAVLRAALADLQQD